MAGLVERVVVVGGGSAGWLAACRIAAEHGQRGLQTTLVEAPDIPIIGVGEGTWPSMRGTLQAIGFAEDELLVQCDASFKQGTAFVGWQGEGGDSYLHPFSPPAEYPALSLAPYWLASASAKPFADFVCPQAAVIKAGLAPKQAETPPYAFNVNYAYHLDANAFAQRLQRHAVERLGVRHLQAKVTGLECNADGDLTALQHESSAQTPGDLFIDCTGSRALLLGEHYGVPSKPAQRWLFNDRALAVQAPYASESAPIAPTTIATAQNAGWIWDIGLQSRRGLGHVYSSAHCTEEEAQQALQSHLSISAAPDSPALSQRQPSHQQAGVQRQQAPQSSAPNQPQQGACQSAGPEQLSYRSIKFAPGYRETPWVRNCVALGMAAGFVEPLEASALALVEQGAAMLASQLPRDKSLMQPVANRYNRKMRYHWQQIIEFLKLHYCLSQRRDTAYWQDHCREDSWPSSLADKLALWHQQPPGHDDAPVIEELFPAASYQYILYGMGFRPRHSLAEGAAYARHRARADRALHQAAQESERLTQSLPPTRTLIAARLGNASGSASASNGAMGYAPSGSYSASALAGGSAAAQRQQQGCGASAASLNYSPRRGGVRQRKALAGGGASDASEHPNP